MNVQIFGTNKCFDTKKAIRYFKERNIKYQFIDMKEKGLSKGEYNSVKQAVGGLENLLNPNCKDKDALALIKYISDEDKDEKVLENQKVVVVKHFCNTLFENSPGISSFKWCFPIIVGMRTDMIVPYVHISV